VHTPVRISALSTEYVYSFFGGALGSEPVEIAFVQGAEPGDEDWQTAEWGDVTPQGADARILVGPEAVALTPGIWQMWVRVTGALERPVRHAGSIEIV